MIPRKVKTLYPAIISETSVSEDVLDDVLAFYWKEVYQEMTEPTSIAINLCGFGSFETRKTQLMKSVEDCKRQLKYMKPTTYAKHFMLDKAAKKVVLFEKLLELHKEQEEKKKRVRELQKNGKTV